jgi:hypothetical protein
VVETAVSASGRRPQLILVWGLLAVLLGAIVAVEVSDREQTRTEERAQAGRDPRALVPVPLEEFGAVEIAHGGAVHRFERDASGAWFYHGAHAPADASHTHQTHIEQANRIDKALGVFSRIRTERQFAPEKGLQEYGLATPQMVVLVYAPKQLQPLAQFAVGDKAPDGVSQYIMPVGGKSIVTIPTYQIDNLLGLLQAVSGAPAAGPPPKSTSP